MKGKANLGIESLDSLTPIDIAELPPEALADLADDLVEAANTLRLRRGVFEAALERRYGAKQQQARIDRGKDTGLIRLLDGNFTVKVDTPNRKVEWDQAKLREIDERILKAGDNPSIYMRIETVRSVREQAYNDFPEAIRNAFEPARTVKVGKLSYSFERPKEMK